MNEKRRSPAGGPTPLGGIAGVLPGGAERGEKTVLGRRPTAAAAAAGSTVGLCGQQKTSGREARGGRARVCAGRVSAGRVGLSATLPAKPPPVLVCDTEGSWGGGTQNDAARGSPVSALPGTPPPLCAATVPPPPAGPGEGPAPFRNEAARPAELGSGSGVWAPKPALCRAAHQLLVGVACRSLPSRSRSPTLCWPTTMQTCGGWFSWGRGDFAPQGMLAMSGERGGCAGEGLLASAG